MAVPVLYVVTCLSVVIYTFPIFQFQNGGLVIFFSKMDLLTTPAPNNKAEKKIGSYNLSIKPYMKMTKVRNFSDNHVQNIWD